MQGVGAGAAQSDQGINYLSVEEWHGGCRSKGLTVSGLIEIIGLTEECLWLNAQEGVSNM